MTFAEDAHKKKFMFHFVLNLGNVEWWILMAFAEDTPKKNSVRTKMEELSFARQDISPMGKDSRDCW